jgi:hypothetical protein
MSHAKAVLQRAFWTFTVAFASVIAVLTPTGLWDVNVWRAAVGSGIIAVAGAVKNWRITPPEAREGAK